MSYGDKIEDIKLEELLSEDSFEQLLSLVSAAGELPADIEHEMRSKIWEFFERYKDYGFDAVVVMLSDGTPVLVEYNKEIIDRIRELQEIELDPTKTVGYIGIIVGIYDNAEKALMQIAREPAMRVILEGKYGYVIISRVPTVEDLVIAASIYVEKGTTAEVGMGEEGFGGFPLGIYLVAFDELVRNLKDPLKERRMS